jgi:hypothetical protein
VGTRTVRLDEQTERTLHEIRRATGLSISDVLKQGVLAVRDGLARTASRKPYQIYAQLNLGPGGYAIAPSTNSRRGVRKALRRKLGR